MLVVFKRPHKTHVMQVLAPVSHHWFDIGIELKIPYNELESLRRVANDPDIIKLSLAIQVWLNQSENPVWQQLLEVLEGPHINALQNAYELRQFLSKPAIYYTYVSQLYSLPSLSLSHSLSVCVCTCIYIYIHTYIHI